MSPPLVQLDEVALTLRRSDGPVPALRGVSLRIDLGESLGVIGVSGSGKTSLARVLLGLVRPTRGHRRLGKPLLRFHAVFQDPASSLNPALDVRRILSEPLLGRARHTEREITSAATRALVGVGLDATYLPRLPWQLSGGEQQRVAVARAVLAEPDILVLDEPVSSLDAVARHGVLELIEGLHGQGRPALVLISHDLRDAERVTERVIVLSDGLIVEEGPTEAVLQHPRHPLTRALIAHR